MDRLTIIKGLQALYSKHGSRLAATGEWTNATRAACKPLRAGDEGEAVELLQEALILYGYDVAANGVFTNSTTQAVLALQESHGIHADGIAGRSVFSLLLNDPDDNVDARLSDLQTQLDTHAETDMEIMVAVAELGESEDELMVAVAELGSLIGGE